MNDLAFHIKTQDLIEKSLSKGADMPLYAPSLSKVKELLTAAKAARAAAPANEYKRAILNRMIAMRRDLRMRIGRHGALHLSEALGLRANYETGDRLA